MSNIDDWLWEVPVKGAAQKCREFCDYDHTAYYCSVTYTAARVSAKPGSCRYGELTVGSSLPGFHNAVFRPLSHSTDCPMVSVAKESLAATGL